MIIEWFVGVLLGGMSLLVGVVRAVMPGFEWDWIAVAMGAAAQMNAILPVNELVTVGGLIVGWRLVAAPVTALIGRWSVGFKIW